MSFDYSNKFLIEYIIIYCIIWIKLQTSPTLCFLLRKKRTDLYKLNSIAKNSKIWSANPSTKYSMAKVNLIITQKRCDSYWTRGQICV